MINIFDMGARKRRNRILKNTDSSQPIKNRLESAYRKSMNLARISRNPITKLKAKKDANYFKRKLDRYK